MKISSSNFTMALVCVFFITSACTSGQFKGPGGMTSSTEKKKDTENKKNDSLVVEDEDSAFDWKPTDKPTKVTGAYLVECGPDLNYDGSDKDNIGFGCAYRSDDGQKYDKEIESESWTIQIKDVQSQKVFVPSILTKAPLESEWHVLFLVTKEVFQHGYYVGAMVNIDNQPIKYVGGDPQPTEPSSTAGDDDDDDNVSPAEPQTFTADSDKNLSFAKGNQITLHYKFLKKFYSGKIKVFVTNSDKALECLQDEYAQAFLAYSFSFDDLDNNMTFDKTFVRNRIDPPKDYKYLICVYTTSWQWTISGWVTRLEKVAGQIEMIDTIAPEKPGLSLNKGWQTSIYLTVSLGGSGQNFRIDDYAVIDIREQEGDKPLKSCDEGQSLKSWNQESIQWTLSYTHKDLERETQYQYIVCAKDSSGNISLSDPESMKIDN